MRKRAFRHVHPLKTDLSSFDTRVQRYIFLRFGLKVLSDCVARGREEWCIFFSLFLMNFLVLICSVFPNDPYFNIFLMAAAVITWLYEGRTTSHRTSTY